MAGRGSRFQDKGYPFPKPLIDILGKPMIIRAVESLELPDARYLFVIAQNQYTEQVKQTIKEHIADCMFIEIDYVTEGPANSALLYKEHINNTEELVIANCDQIMEWNSTNFLLNVRQYDGAVVTYHNDTDKNSYARVDKRGFVTEIREKEVISNISLNGIHYWKQGSYFVDSAEAMIAADDRAPNGEFYVGPTYNYMIKVGQTVGIYHIPNQQHHPVGVPIDLENYLIHEKAKN
jgi:NDP-sugar pyrophosphorylase family protein